MKQIGPSPKVVAAALTGLVVYVLTKLAVEVDPAIEQAINVMAMILAGIIAPPGTVAENVGEASDDLLDTPPGL